MGFLDRLVGREARETYPPQVSAPAASQVPSPYGASQDRYSAVPASGASPDERAVARYR